MRNRMLSIVAAGLGLGLGAAGAASAHSAASLIAPGPVPVMASAPRPAAPSAATAGAKRADFLGQPRSSDAGFVADWVAGTGDNHGQPFVIVDKKATQVFVFDGDGRLLGAASALLGLARGDDSAPDVGRRKLADIPPQERTTPAGRFVASLGYGLGKQDILWVDYAAALALHRVLAADTREHRLQRLAAASPLDRRITFGCINVPAAFYDAVIHTAFERTSGVVYILPEIKPIAEVFPASGA